ncbi:hypothetical protein Y032_0182g885 [Ancylostoma ceylanicum]|uniref:Uncharacterized protein n=1 Tax=Ancylostoma ceylanicum TaxID=53326 RepID=A0A016SST4_9BILA|nr:hypothetical protein Y032_0182g885 [Ancylostoma ceylanicum]
MAINLAGFVWHPRRRACQLARQTKSVKCLAKQEVPKMCCQTNLSKCIAMRDSPNESSSEPYLLYRQTNLYAQNFDNIENRTSVLISGVLCFTDCAIRVDTDAH